MAKTLLVLGAGWEQVPLVERAVAEGWSVVACGPIPRSEAFSLAEASAVIDSRDLMAVLGFAQEHAIDAVTSDQCDYSRYAQAWLAERLGLPGPLLRAVGATVNKKWLREACDTSDVPQPVYAACRSVEDATKAAKTIGYPVVVKPVDNRGSFGVTRVDAPDELSPAWSEAVAHSHSREVLVEQFIDGTVITVDGAHVPGRGHHALGVATKGQVAGRRQVAMEIVYPGELNSQHLVLAEQRANEVGTVLQGFGATGLTHTEFVFDGRDFFLLESANRGGGVYTSNVIIPTYSGFDTTGLLLAEAAGSPFASEYTRVVDRALMLRFLTLEPGRLRSVGGLEDALAAPGVLAGRLYLRAGDKIGSIANATHRNGFLIVEASNVAEARSRFDAAIKRLAIVYE